jgi:hypothetical protein
METPFPYADSPSTVDCTDLITVVLAFLKCGAAAQSLRLCGGSVEGAKHFWRKEPSRTEEALRKSADSVSYNLQKCGLGEKVETRMLGLLSPVREE